MSNKCPNFGDNDVRNCPYLRWIGINIFVDIIQKIPVCHLHEKNLCICKFYSDRRISV